MGGKGGMRLGEGRNLAIIVTLGCHEHKAGERVLRGAGWRESEMEREELGKGLEDLREGLRVPKLHLILPLFGVDPQAASMLVPS